MIGVQVQLSGTQGATLHVTGLQAGLEYLQGRRAVVGTDRQYGLYVDQGTNPHDIYPKTKRALAFPARGTPTTRGGNVTASARRSLPNGGLTIVRHVHHPGTKPTHFLTGVLAVVQEQVLARLTLGITEAALEGKAAPAVQALQQAGLLVQAEAQRRAPVRTGTLRRSLHTVVYAR